jgi:glycosyltransferase involved in cell wall biosynthesis
LREPITPEVAGLVSAYPVFSRKHGELLCKLNPAIPPERCVVTGLGVELAEYPLPFGSTNPKYIQKVPGRIWVGNDPARGLVNTLDVFDLVRKRVPHATLRVTYDLERQFARVKWQHNAAAEVLWECKRRLENTPGVSLLGAVDRATVVREQLEAQVHLWPSDPVNVGSQIHGLSQAEAAAAGCALVLSDVEAFPEVFGEAAVILPTIGTFAPGPDEDGSRIDAQDYADAVVELMTDAAKWAEASRKARKLAEKNDWADVTGTWLLMLDKLAAGQKKAA